METIYALATAPGRAGVAVVRVSGPAAHAVAAGLTGPLPADRGLRDIRDAAGELIDTALVLTFPDRKSFTGDPVVELHLHGSPVIVRAVLAALAADGRARQAEAGEFTRRALQNGRLDLAQVEGLSDLLAAETEAQRRQAMRVFSGQLGDLADDWRRDLLRAVSLVEATIDFVDEDVPVDVFPEVLALIAAVADGMRREAEGVKIAERIRDGFEVAILGAPNVGKSTLLNRLAGREAAITSHVAGTTRDVIEVQMELAGLPVTFLDTAGLRETDDEIERIGVDRALKRAEAADLRVFLVTGTEAPPLPPRAGDVVLLAKADLLAGESPGISGLTGEGVDNLIADLGDTLSRRASGAGVAMRERHRQALILALQGLDAAADGIAAGVAEDLIAEDLRQGLRAVDMIVGRVDVEDVLGEIFANFCIGK